MSNFPNSPTPGVTTHTIGNKTWLWNGTAWVIQGGSSVYVTSVDIDTLGQILVSYSNNNVVNLGDVIELNDPNYPVDGGNFDLDGGEF
jgi:hypothetical protein